MTTPALSPGSYVVHPGLPAPTGARRQRLCAWLHANGINPDRVPLTEPIVVLTVPETRRLTTPRGKPWLLQVIVFTEFYTNADGLREANLLTSQIVTVQRTVPLTVPYPTTEEDTDGSTQEVRPVEEDQRPPEHQERPEGDEQQEFRPAAQEEVPDRRSASRQERARARQPARIEQRESAGPKGGRRQVPEPQEEADRRPAAEEEVTGQESA